jgi:hypothetical protein
MIFSLSNVIRNATHNTVRPKRTRDLVSVRFNGSPVVLDGNPLITIQPIWTIRHTTWYEGFSDRYYSFYLRRLSYTLPTIHVWVVLPRPLRHADNHHTPVPYARFQLQNYYFILLSRLYDRAWKVK